MADGDTHPTLEELVKLLRHDRASFAAFYDQNRPQGAPNFKTVAVLRVQPPGESAQDRDRLDMLAALKLAQEGGWLDVFSPTKARALFSDVKDAVQFQAIANPNIDFDHIGELNDGLLKAMQRCCRIVCTQGETPVQGSGFLIGPQLVLTNWHVVSGQMQGGAPAADSHARIRVEFDAYKRRNGDIPTPTCINVARQWLVAFSAAHEEDKNIETLGVQRPMPLDRELLKTLADFAVIALATPVGYQRGWYNLSAAIASPADGAMGQLVQFPGSYAMRVTGGAYDDPTLYPARVVHRMNAIGGSSGGLCATTSYEPLALHQGALLLQEINDEGAKVRAGIRNIAIPLATIAELAGDEIALRTREAPRIVHSTQPSAGDIAAPIAGRRDLQAAIHSAAHGDTRIILVRNSYSPETGAIMSRVGKSFTMRILEAMVEPDANVIRVVSAADIPSHPYAAAAKLAEPFRDLALDSQAVEAFAALDAAQPADDTSLQAAVIPLAELVATALRRAAGPRTLWLVIDDLDRHPIEPSSGTADLLNLLYRMISADPQLRAVLIGSTSELASLVGLNYLSEGPLRHIQQADIEDWIKLRSGPARVMPQEMSSAMADMAMTIIEKWPASPPLSRTEIAAAVLAEYIGPNLK